MVHKSLITGELKICSHCNTGLGKAKDSPEILRKMADYIEENR